jgi:hypothetical protein
LKKALEEFNPDAGERVDLADSQPMESLGFRFGAAYTLSAAMGTLSDLQALSPELETKLEGFLLASMKNGYWTSTFDTAQVIFNSRGVLDEEAAAYAKEKQTAARKIVVRGSDGSALGELSRIPAGFTGSFAGAGGTGAYQEIALEGIAPNEIAYATVSVDVPFASVNPRSHGLVVERKLMLISPKGVEPLDPSRPLHKGDVVVSEVQVSRYRIDSVKAAPSRFLVIEDGIPSFAQPVDDDRTYLADAKIRPVEDNVWESIKDTLRYPEKTARIADAAPGSKLRVYQVWRVAFSGKATASPARAFDMYDESIQGNSEAVGLRAE